MASLANSRSIVSPVPTIRTDRQASCSKNSSGAPVQPLAEPHAAHWRCPPPGTDLVCPVPSNKGSPPMSNCYTHSCFVLHITAAESGLLREAIALAQYIEDQPDAEAIIQHWLGLSEAFRTIFPPTGEEVVSGFLAIFPDCDFPTFGTDFSFEQQADGIVRVFATADQFEPDAVAVLLHRTITQSLPVAVTWSVRTVTRHQPDCLRRSAGL